MASTPYLIGVGGDNYLVSYLCPHGERHDEWVRRSYNGGAVALEQYCRGLLESKPAEVKLDVAIVAATSQPHAPEQHQPACKPGTADGPLSSGTAEEWAGQRLLLHRVHEVEDEKNRKLRRWYIDTAPPVGEREYVAANFPFHKCLPPNEARMSPHLLLIRDSGREGYNKAAFYEEINEDCNVIRFSSPLVSTTWKATELPKKARFCRSWTEIIDIDQIARIRPIAKGGSYEAITRDLLRFFAKDDPRRIFQVPVKDPDSKDGGRWPAVTFVVRLHSSAMLVVAYPIADETNSGSGKTKDEHQNCCLIFHPKRPAPVMAGKKNKIGGTGAMLAAHLAIHLATCFRQQSQPALIFNTVAEGVKGAIVLGDAASELGLEFLGKDYDSEDFPLEKFIAKCVTKSNELDSNGSSPIRLDFERTTNPTNEANGSALTIDDDLQQIKSIHTEWLIQNVRTRQWRRKMDAEGRFGGKIVCNHCHPASIVAGDKSIREDAMNHVHSVNIKKSRLVDRNEVEDYLAMQSVLKSYATTPEAPRPLNLGVFGAPGSGKSFGVKQLVEYCGNSGLAFAEKILEFNMSQFGSTTDLADSLHQVRDMCMSGKIPVAFFDEFDATFNGANFGWLKYLLMPMQDSVFWDQNKQYRLGRCVLIFAGGINRSFHELNGRIRDQEFVIAKGPDFVSRLRGYLNIRSINFPEDATPVDRQRCQLRRAVLLENLLERKHGGKSINAPLLDLPLAHAMLNIEGFRHGVRSLEAILDMSEFVKMETLLASSLPTWAQIEMHVDSRQWAKLLMEGEEELEWLKL